MKKQTVSLLVLHLLVRGLGSVRKVDDEVACRLGGITEEMGGFVHLYAVELQRSGVFVHGVTTGKEKAACRKQKDSLNTYFLSACFGEKYMGMTPEEAVKKYTEKYVGDYRKDLEPMYRKDEQDKENAGEIGAWYSYYKGIESHVQLYTGHLLVYRIDYNEYTGGAHGIYMSTFLNLDLRTLAPIRLDDLFAGDYKEQLTDLLWNQLMADNKVATRQELEDMGYVTTGDLTPTENFYLGKDGITFYYNVYDIAPYVMGPVKITLPYEMMQHLLSDETMALNDVRNP